MAGGRTILLLRTNHSDSDQLHRSKGKETRWCYKFVEYLRWNLGWFMLDACDKPSYERVSLMERLDINQDFKLKDKGRVLTS